MLHSLLFAALLPLLLPAAMSAPQSDAESAIRVQRDAFNVAIAARATERFDEFLVPDAETVGGNGTALHSSAAYAEIIARIAQDPEFVTYVRTPDEIVVDTTGTQASEYGHWRGLWQRGDEESAVIGNYMAQWRLVDGVWKIRAELFVALACVGFDCESRLGPR